MMIYKNLLKIFLSFFVVLIPLELVLNLFLKPCNTFLFRYNDEVNRLENPAGNSICIPYRGGKKYISFNKKKYKNTKYEIKDIKYIIHGSSLALGWPFQESTEHFLNKKLGGNGNVINCSVVDQSLPSFSRSLEGDCTPRDGQTLIYIMTMHPSAQAFSVFYEGGENWLKTYGEVRKEHPDAKIYYSYLDKFPLKYSTIYQMLFRGVLSHNLRKTFGKKMGEVFKSYHLSGENYAHKLQEIASSIKAKKLFVLVPSYEFFLARPDLNNNFKFDKFDNSINRTYVNVFDKTRADDLKKYYEEYLKFKLEMKKMGLVVLDINEFLFKENFNKYYIGYFDHHPNLKGYEFLADKIAEIIRKELQ